MIYLPDGEGVIKVRADTTVVVVEAQDKYGGYEWYKDLDPFAARRLGLALIGAADYITTCQDDYTIVRRSTYGSE